jgi:Mrp family chromosome partitioning ATPase
MSEVLQLSGASVWPTVETTTGPERPSASRVSPPPPTDEDRQEKEHEASVVSVTDKLARLHSGATPYLQHLMKLVHRIFLTPDRLGGPIRSVVFSAVDTRDADDALLPAAAAELLASRVTGRVCLVDADFYAPSLHSCYGVNNDIGLIDALSNSGPVRSYARRLVQGPDTSLWLLPSGSSGNRRELLLTSQEVQARITDLLAAFDFVIIAAPSMTQHPAVAALGGQVDGIVMIAEAHVTRRRAMRACADALRASGGRVLGTVLNNRTFPIPEAIYRLL